MGVFDDLLPAMTGMSGLVATRSTAFSPASLPGLALWLDASDATTLFQNSNGTTAAASDGDPVGYWGDKSGNGRHATTSTSSQRPTRKNNIQGGLPALLFDATDDRLSTPSFATFPAKRGSVFAVVNNPAQGWAETFLATHSGPGVTWELLCGGHASVKPFAWWDGDAVRLLESGASVVTGASQLSLVRAADATISFWRDGAAKAGTAILDNQPASNPVFLGSYSGGGEYYSGYLCEILIYDSALSAADRLAVEAYLMAKWGTP